MSGISLSQNFESGAQGIREYEYFKLQEVKATAVEKELH